MASALLSGAPSMLFNSLVFMIFLPVVLGVYYRLTHRAQNIWLLAASCLFYGWWDWRFLGLMFFSAFIDFFAARAIEDSQDKKKQKRLLLLSLFVNLGTLGFFKYFNFFVDNAQLLLEGFGLHPSMSTLEIILPVGISFYTFQALSYTIDVYRGELKAVRDPVDYALYVSYFPQLVAGPIERATALMPQILERRKVTFLDIREGFAFCVIGFFKKVGVADAIGPLADARFHNVDFASGYDLLIGLYFFSFQIYCDFSGYSDIARGTSRFFGIKLMSNFERPYFSSSITEFWRRWHISLSTWLRDYLYITLGGNRGGTAKTYRNLMLTMLIGGFWHGASWAFVIWGGLHGLYLSVHKFWLEASSRPAKERFIVRLVKGLIIFHLVAVAWIFFRAPTFDAAWSYLTGIVTWRAGQASLFTPRDANGLLMILALLFFDGLQERGDGPLYFLTLSVWRRALCYSLMILLLLIFGGIGAQLPFIYFQF